MKQDGVMVAARKHLEKSLIIVQFDEHNSRTFGYQWSFHSWACHDALSVNNVHEHCQWRARHL